MFTFTRVRAVAHLRCSKATTKPQLATDYKWSNNNLTLTLTLRQGVKFHDGSDFNADAAIWNLQQNIDAQVGGSDNIAGLKKVDDYTMEINLKQYQNTWVIGFAGSDGSETLADMMSPTAYKTKGKEWCEQNPVGTGPYKFDKYVQNESISLVRNDNYWGPKPILDGVEWLIVPDAVTAELAFQAGQADGIINVSLGNQLRHDLSVKGYPYKTANGMPWVLVPSSANPNSPWSKLDVREAAEYAIDKAGICQSVYYGYAKPLETMSATYQIPYDANFKGRDYDVAKAKELLAQAGYPNGFSDTFYLAQMFNDNSITAIQNDLAADRYQFDHQCHERRKVG